MRAHLRFIYTPALSFHLRIHRFNYFWECLLTRLPHLKCIIGWLLCVQVTFDFKYIMFVTCVQVYLMHVGSIATPIIFFLFWDEKRKRTQLFSYNVAKKSRDCQVLFFSQHFFNIYFYLIIDLPIYKMNLIIFNEAWWYRYIKAQLRISKTNTVG